MLQLTHGTSDGQIYMTLCCGSETHQTRRGILNIVGELSHSLFGTVMDSEVVECQQQIEWLQTRDRRVIYPVSKMLLVIHGKSWVNDSFS